MSRTPSPFDLLRLHSDTCLMLFEAQTVAALRLMGIGGLWPVAQTETARMMAEKAPAFAEAAGAAMVVAARGGTPFEMSSAWLRPIRRVTRANSRRLRRVR
jgi:hypothetical protein